MNPAIVLTPEQIKEYRFGRYVDPGDPLVMHESHTSKKHLGTGYGLPIARRYIEAHGGKIDITSEEDKGTTFAVLLPLEPKIQRTPPLSP